jgi:SSS family solute:Na+ symporter
MLTFAVSIAFGVAMFPQVNQRFFTADSETVLKRSFALWPVLVLLLFVPAFLLGTWARGLGVTADLAAGENVLPPLLAAYTSTWFAAVVIAGAVAAMMSSSDSMLLSGSSYFTRDLYRPLVDDAISDRREDLLGRAGVVVFAVGALVATLRWGRSPGAVGEVLVNIGDVAFGGFAQLTLPVVVALYWSRTTRDGVLAGIAVPTLVYLPFRLDIVGPYAVELPGVGDLSLFAPAYFGWGVSLYCMALGLALTVGVSLLTSPAPAEDRSVYFEGLGAD